MTENYWIIISGVFVVAAIYCGVRAMIYRGALMYLLEKMKYNRETRTFTIDKTEEMDTIIKIITN